MNQSTKQEHTPTPWDLKQIKSTGIIENWSFWAPINAGYDQFGYFMGDEANAAFIVNAVNSHDALLDALKKIAEGRGTFSLDPFKHACNTIEEMIAIANNAISSAEGK